MADGEERDFKSSYSPKYLIVFAQEHVNFRLEVQLFIVRLYCLQRLTDDREIISDKNA